MCSSATANSIPASGDACPNDPGKHAALKYVPSAGVNLIGEAAVEDNTESPIVSATLLVGLHWFVPRAPANGIPSFSHGFIRLRASVPDSTADLLFRRALSRLSHTRFRVHLLQRLTP